MGYLKRGGLTFLMVGLVTNVCVADTVYVAFGDSITAGAWASTHLPGSELIAPPGSSGPTGSVRFFERKESLSWATGRMIQSFAKRLENSAFRKLGGGAFLTFNVARSGVPSGDLDRQFELFRRELKRAGPLRKESQLVVTLLIGANDICSREMKWGPLERAQYRLNVVKLIHQLESLPGFKTRRILISSIPKTSPLGDPPISDARMFGGWTCKQVRDGVLKICPSLFTWKTLAERDQIDSVWNDMNAMLSEIAADKWKKAEVAFSWAFSQQQPRADYLAQDCFHPNLQGHALIADQIWADQRWF
ncbi:MAG: hypothetical protein K2X47_17760 [Bdellovibrionales bacterium]|nr:hypothetical protein [Bdellovibrionales bacterium]